MWGGKKCIFQWYKKQLIHCNNYRTKVEHLSSDKVMYHIEPGDLPQWCGRNLFDPQWVRRISPWNLLYPWWITVKTFRAFAIISYFFKIPNLKRCVVITPFQNTVPMSACWRPLWTSRTNLPYFPPFTFTFICVRYSYEKFQWSFEISRSPEEHLFSQLCRYSVFIFLCLK